MGLPRIVASIGAVDPVDSLIVVWNYRLKLVLWQLVASEFLWVLLPYSIDTWVEWHNTSYAGNKTYHTNTLTDICKGFNLRLDPRSKVYLQDQLP